MDQNSLVRDQIDAGALLVTKLEEVFPIAAAFWLQEDEGGLWYLYIASDKITDVNRSDWYAEVSRVARAMNDPSLNVFRVKLVSADHPLAKAARAILQTHPEKAERLLTGLDCIGLDVAWVYLYPLPNDRWNGISVMVFNEPQDESAYRVEFWPHGLQAAIGLGGQPRKVPRPAKVHVEKDRVTFSPPEKPDPYLGQSDYEQKAMEAVTQLGAKRD